MNTVRERDETDNWALRWWTHTGQALWADPVGWFLSAAMTALIGIPATLLLESKGLVEAVHEGDASSFELGALFWIPIAWLFVWPMFTRGQAAHALSVVQGRADPVELISGFEARRTTSDAVLIVVHLLWVSALFMGCFFPASLVAAIAVGGDLFTGDGVAALRWSAVLGTGLAWAATGLAWFTLPFVQVDGEVEPVPSFRRAWQLSLPHLPMLSLGAAVWFVHLMMLDLVVELAWRGWRQFLWLPYPPELGLGLEVILVGFTLLALVAMHAFTWAGLAVAYEELVWRTPAVDDLEDLGDEAERRVRAVVLMRRYGLNRGEVSGALGVPASLVTRWALAAPSKDEIGTDDAETESWSALWRRVPTAFRRGAWGWAWASALLGVPMFLLSMSEAATVFSLHRLRDRLGELDPERFEAARAFLGLTEWAAWCVVVLFTPWLVRVLGGFANAALTGEGVVAALRGKGKDPAAAFVQSVALLLLHILTLGVLYLLSAELNVLVWILEGPTVYGETQMAWMAEWATDLVVTAMWIPVAVLLFAGPIARARYGWTPWASVRYALTVTRGHRTRVLLSQAPALIALGCVLLTVWTVSSIVVGLVPESPDPRLMAMAAGLSLLFWFPLGFLCVGLNLSVAAGWFDALDAFAKEHAADLVADGALTDAELCRLFGVPAAGLGAWLPPAEEGAA